MHYARSSGLYLFFYVYVIVDLCEAIINVILIADYWKGLKS